MGNTRHERGLAVLVAKPETETTADALRAEGVYDDRRGIQPHGPDRIALPVTDPPVETPVDAVVERELPVRDYGLRDILRDRGWGPDELAAAPGSWAVVGDVILVDLGDAPDPAEVGEALLDLHGNAETVLAREGIRGRWREPSVRVVAGTDETETIHIEHGIQYALDLREVMFSPGNKAERVRMGDAVSDGERVFDMFAGIGYFTLPMARAGGRIVATEVNPTAYRYLVENVQLNAVQDNVEAYRANCRAIEATADRVVMGHYEAYEYLDSAFASVVPGGRLHMHAATPSALVPERPTRRLERAADRTKRSVEIDAVRRVKGYSEGVDHVVVDATLE